MSYLNKQIQMKNIQKTSLTKFILTIFLCYSVNTLNAQLPYSSPEKQGFSSERLEKITELSKNYIKENRLPNIINMVSRNGKIVYFKNFGYKGIEDKSTIKKNDLFRIYSMTKPITAVAAMQLYEQGKFKLKDKVSKYIPELKNLKVLNENGVIVDVKNEMTMQQLFTHTAGFSYGFNNNDVIDKLYIKAKLWNSKNSDEFISKVSKLPLKNEPGKVYHYSIAVDITGVIVERLSGLTLDEYFKKNIFEPLGMNDTFFEVPKAKRNRFIPNNFYNYKKGKPETITSEYWKNRWSYDTNEESRVYDDYFNVKLYSGGGGLVSTAMDFMIFAECIRNGGIFNKKRILSPKTINYMIKNHLNSSLVNEANTGENLNSNNTNGFGFGLGFGLITNTQESAIIGSEGEYFWGGAAGTVFWIDPVEEIIVVSMIQLMDSPWSLREDLKIATYQALIESFEN